MAGSPESKVRDPAVKWWKGLGYKHIRFAFRRGVTSGWPDDLFLVPGGTPMFIEFKGPGKVPTPLQQQRAVELWEQGYDVCWTDSTDAAKRTLLSRVGATAVYGTCQGPSGGPACWRAGA